MSARSTGAAPSNRVCCHARPRLRRAATAASQATATAFAAKIFESPASSRRRPRAPRCVASILPSAPTDASSRWLTSSLPLPQIIVERLSKNVHEGHLREIFGRYGPIQDLDLPINRTCEPPAPLPPPPPPPPSSQRYWPIPRRGLANRLATQVGTNRGTAYILFRHREDAEAAISNMHEGQIDGAVINVSIVLPRRMLSPEPPLARRGANIDPRVPFNGPPRGGRGPRGFPGPGGYHDGVGPVRRRPSPPGRYGPRPPAYYGPERSRSRSPFRSPPRGPRDLGGGFRQRSASYDSYASRPRSKSPPMRLFGGSRRFDDGPRRCSRNRSFDSYGGGRNRSFSPRRGYR